MKKILILAGEESGVLYAQRLKKCLREAAGEEIEFRGYDTEGFVTGDLAVMGFVPVLMRLRYFLRVAKTMKSVIAEWKPDAVVTIDYPGLNLKLAAYAKGLGIKAVHVVCPQVWAWHQGRIPKVAAALTKLLCFFPFEPDLFKGTGLDAKFIGHPLVDVFAQESANGEVVGDEKKNLVAILPGSRVGEIRRNLPRQLEAVKILSEKISGGIEVEIPAANDRAETEIKRVAEQCGCQANVMVTKGGARDLLRRAKCAAVASGTATLEAALARCPTVLVYAVSPLFAWIARRVIKGVHYIGLANIIWEKSGAVGEAPMPELIQEDFTPQRLAAMLESVLASDMQRAKAIARLDETMAKLHSDGDALGLAAREILQS